MNKKLLLAGLLIVSSYVDEGLLQFSSLKVCSTAYSPLKRECDNTPFIAATGRKVFEGGVAVSRELEKILPLGSYFWIGKKPYIINDRMNKKWKDLRVDIFFFNKKDALKYGKKEVVIKYLPVSIGARRIK